MQPHQIAEAARQQANTPGPKTSFPLASLFGFSTMTISEDCTVERLCEFIGRKDMRTKHSILYFNGLTDDRQLLTAGRRVLVPGNISADILRVEEVSVADVRAMSVEAKLRSYSVEPVFFVYLATGLGEVLGKLILTDMEVMFDPLSERFKGQFNYEHGDIVNNTRMGTIVNYRDVCGEVQKLAFEEVEEGEGAESTATRFGVQLNLHHTGNLYYAKGLALELQKKLNDQNLPLASFCLKINAFSLTGELLSQDKQEEIADQLIATIEKRVFKAKNGTHISTNDSTVQSMTSVPFFDINFENILSILIPGYQERPNLGIIDKNLQIFRQLFGLRLLGETIAFLPNQSIYPLGNKPSDLRFDSSRSSRATTAS